MKAAPLGWLSLQMKWDNQACCLCSSGEIAQAGPAGRPSSGAQLTTQADIRHQGAHCLWTPVASSGK